MKKYLQVVGIGVQNTLTYRANFLFRAAFGLIPLMSTIYLWRAIYAGNGASSSVSGYDLAGMTSYYVLVTMVDALTAVTDDDWQIAEDIKNGNISQFLLKPIDYLSYRFCLYFAGRMIYTLVAAGPVIIFVYWLRRYWVFTAGWQPFVCSLFSLGLTALLQFLMSYTMALLAFWVAEVSTFIFMVFAVEYIAGGHLFPLNILPPLWEKVLSFTPFPYLLYFPISIYLGKISGAEIWRGLAIQALWVLGAYAAARWIWSRGVKKYSAVGG